MEYPKSKNTWLKIAKENGYASEKEFLYDWYWTQDIESSVIGARIGKTPNAIIIRMRKLGIQPKPRGGKRPGPRKKPKGTETCTVRGCKRKRRDNDKDTRWCSLCESAIRNGHVRDDEEYRVGR